VPVRTPAFDLPGELALVAARFREAVETPEAAAATADPGITPENIVPALPYLLVDALPFEGSLEAARSMAVANCLGAVHFLAGDDWLDGDDRPEPESCRLADRCLGRFYVAYDRLAGGEASAVSLIEGYLDQYYESLAWERDVLRTGSGLAAVAPDRIERSLDTLGRRLAPLKTTVAAICRLAGRTDAARAGERFLDEFHVAYQLEDDLADLLPDLRARRWSVVSWLLAAASGLESPPSGEDVGEVVRAASSVLGDVAAEIDRRYGRAIGHAGCFGATRLAGFAAARREGALRSATRAARRARIIAAERRGGAARPSKGGGGASLAGCASTLLEGLHVFRVGPDGFVFDSGSGLFFEADGVARDVLEWLETGAADAGLQRLVTTHGRAGVDAAVGEIATLAGAPAAPGRTRRGASPSGLTSIALNLTESCNLDCDYCYLSSERRSRGRSMPEAVAVRAVEMLLGEPSGSRRLSVVFFGGEPLLRLGLIERVARRARALASERRREVALHITTNGTLLTPETAGRLHAAGVRMLVSIDGPREAHDAHRRYPDGRGSYERIAANIRSLPRSVRVAARVTVSPSSASLADTVTHLAGLGFRVVHLVPASGGTLTPAFGERLVGEFEALAGIERDRIAGGSAPVVGNFIDPMRLLASGGARGIPCGAGARYVCVDPDGLLYFCHRFAGREEFEVGSVADGLDRAAVARILHARAEATAACADCWALPLCGGPCLHDAHAPGSGADQRGERCRIQQRVLELSMWLYASLPEERRREMASAPR